MRLQAWPASETTNTAKPYYTDRMRWLLAFAVAVSAGVSASAQTRKPARRPPPAALEKIAPETDCPNLLGVGVNSKISFCDVMTGRGPSAGIIIKLPPHRGPVTLTFDLHNRHTYSEEEVKAHHGYRKYTATVAVLTMENVVIGRAVVQSEFRTAADLIDRVGGGAGPGGVKAVAPTGTELITIEIPEDESQVRLVGEKLTIERLDETATYTQPDRPIADVSNVMIEYRPVPAPRPPAKKR